MRRLATGYREREVRTGVPDPLREQPVRLQQTKRGTWRPVQGLKPSEDYTPLVDEIPRPLPERDWSPVEGVVAAVPRERAPGPTRTGAWLRRDADRTTYPNGDPKAWEYDRPPPGWAGRPTGIAGLRF